MASFKHYVSVLTTKLEDGLTGGKEETSDHFWLHCLEALRGRQYLTILEECAWSRSGGKLSNDLVLFHSYLFILKNTCKQAFHYILHPRHTKGDVYIWRSSQKWWLGIVRLMLTSHCLLSKWFSSFSFLNPDFISPCMNVLDGKLTSSQHPELARLT